MQLGRKLDAITEKVEIYKYEYGCGKLLCCINDCNYGNMGK